MALAPVLGSPRAGDAAATSSRELLITLLGELMLPAGGLAWTQTMTTALGLLGVRDKAARQAINRLHQLGWLDRARVGRKTRWTIASPTRELLTDGAVRIYGLGLPTRGWDERWSILLASVPEARRNLRYRLTVGLTWAGYGSLGQGTWISPWPERETEALQVIHELDVPGAVAFRGELGAVGTPGELAARAWDLVVLGAQYDAFLAEFGESDHVSGPADAARRLMALVHRWRRFPLLDPGLPGDLLPDGWSGHRAAELFAARRSAWQPVAATWWSETEAGYSS